MFKYYDKILYILNYFSDNIKSTYLKILYFFYKIFIKNNKNIYNKNNFLQKISQLICSNIMIKNIIFLNDV
jgi:hypothetical protein